MTTPVLDRLIVRNLVVVTPAGGREYVYTERIDTGPGGTAAEWLLENIGQLEIAVRYDPDDDSAFFPELSTGDVVRFAFGNGYTVEVTMTSVRYDPAFNIGFGREARSWQLSFTPALDPALLPAVGAADSNLIVTVPGGTPTNETFTRKVWAGRLGIRNEEQVAVLGGSIAFVESLRSYVVRYVAGFHAWEAQEEFLDEYGVSRRVLSISEYGGRERYLRLLTN